MLCLKGKDLVICVLRDSGSLLSLLVDRKSLRVDLGKLFGVTLVDASLVPLLLSHDINLLSEVLIGGLQLVVFNKVFVKSVFKFLAVSIELLHLSGGR